MADIAAVTQRLTALGYTLRDGDEVYIAIALERAKERIQNKINRQEVPEGLRHTHADMAAGLFLESLRAFGKLSGVDLAAPAVHITEGDVSVQYATGGSTPEARMDALIDGLINPPASVFARYRRLTW